MVHCLSNREKQIIQFIREMGWGDIKIRVENGQPVLIYEAIKTIKLDDEPVKPNKTCQKQIQSNRLNNSQP
ncbi:MAG: hypothetical protein PHT62_05585 [Desulfotomaculaceae bacterium]|nr:hypothetical protein [Desulfotomaculaceae bacterium]